MTKDQIALLKTFFDNEPLSTLIKDALLDGLNRINDLTYDKDNELLGQEVRARQEAHDIIEAKFTDLKRMTRTSPQPSSRNESR